MCFANICFKPVFREMFHFHKVYLIPIGAIALYNTNLKKLSMDTLVVEKGFSYMCFYDICFNPNWHEAGWIYPPYNFRIDFWQLNFYQKLPNIFGGEN